MIDVAAWVQRAKSFVRSLADLPGEIQMDEHIESPASDSFDRQWLDSGRCSLPPEIHRFISVASKRCFFLYRW
jgi:hypothetical protein